MATYSNLRQLDFLAKLYLCFGISIPMIRCESELELGLVPASVFAPSRPPFVDWARYQLSTTSIEKWPGISFPVKVETSDSLVR